MTANRICILFFVIMWPASAASQENNVSPYSFFGIGDLQSGVSSRTSGMASVSTGLAWPLFLNATNPAALTALDTCMLIFDIAGSAKGSSFRAGSATGRTFGANFTRVAAGLHLTPRWAGGLSLQPYSTISYKVESKSYVEGTQITTPTLYEGSGGVTRISFLNSFSLTDKFSLGADLRLLLGNINRIASQSGITVDKSSSGTAFSFVLGMLYKGMLSDKLAFSAGFTYGNSCKLNFDNNMTVTNAEGYIFMDQATASSSLTIPRSMGAGISLTAGRIVFAADYSYQKWSLTKNQISGFNFTDTHRFAGGIALIPARAVTAGFLEHIEYQGGIALSNSYFTLGNINPSIIEITAGAGFPLRDEGQINLGLSWGKQGAVNEGLIREDYIRVTLSFSWAERMFIRRLYY